MAISKDTPCVRCGHPWAAHEHFRSATECSLCSAGDCPAFRQPWYRRIPLVGRVLP